MCVFISYCCGVGAKQKYGSPQVGWQALKDSLPKAKKGGKGKSYPVINVFDVATGYINSDEYLETAELDHQDGAISKILNDDGEEFQSTMQELINNVGIMSITDGYSEKHSTPATSASSSRGALRSRPRSPASRAGLRRTACARAR